MPTNKKRYFVNIYFLLWCLYYSQGTLYETGSIISQSLLAILLLLSIIHFVRTNDKSTPSPLKWLNLLIVMFVVYGLIGIVNGDVFNVGGMTNIGYVKNILVSFLPVYSFYYFTKNGEIDESQLFAWTIILLVVYSFSYLNTRLSELNDPLSAAVVDSEDKTNNAGYLIASLIPLVFFLGKKPLIQYSALALIMFFTVSSMKRGAILVGAAMMLILVLSSLKGRNARQKLAIGALLVGIVYVGVYYVRYLLSTSDFFNMRLEMTLEGDSSNRDDIYTFFYRYFISQADIGRLFLGSGANATLKIYGAFAHNDWLEIAINQGVLGLVLYLGYWISQIKNWRKVKSNKAVYLVLGLVLFYMLFRSFVSMSYMMVPLSCSVALGYCLAKSSTLYLSK